MRKIILILIFFSYMLASEEPKPINEYTFIPKDCNDLYQEYVYYLQNPEQSTDPRYSELTQKFKDRLDECIGNNIINNMSTFKQFRSNKIEQSTDYK